MSDELEAWISRSNLYGGCEALRLLFEQRTEHVTFIQPSLQSIQSVGALDTEEIDWSPLAQENDRYEDMGVLGQGGMGQVRKVKDKRLGRVVAMAIMRPELLSNPREVQRFVEEAPWVHSSSIPVFVQSMSWISPIRRIFLHHAGGQQVFDFGHNTQCTQGIW